MKPDPWPERRYPGEDTGYSWSCASFEKHSFNLNWCVNELKCKIHTDAVTHYASHSPRWTEWWSNQQRTSAVTLQYHKGTMYTAMSLFGQPSLRVFKWKQNEAPGKCLFLVRQRITCCRLVTGIFFGISCWPLFGRSLAAGLAFQAHLEPTEPETKSRTGATVWRDK